MEIEALIFDVDGVLTDTIEFHFLAWKQLAEEEGLSFTREDNERLRGLSRRDSLHVVFKDRPFDEAAAQALMARKNAYFHEYLAMLTPDMRLPGVTDLLNDARTAGLKLGVASSSRNARAVLERLDLVQYFDAIGDANSVVNTKPAPDVFLWVAGRLDVHPAKAVIIEDSAAGITAARAGGFPVLGVGQANVSQAHLVVPDLTAVSLPHLGAQLEAGTLEAAHTTPG